MRWGWACASVLAICGLGCGGREIDRPLGEGSGQAGATESVPTGAAGAGGAAGLAGHPGVGGHPNGCCFSPTPSGAAGAGGATGTAGASGMAGAPGTGGAGTGPTACSSLTIGTAMTLAPAAAGQQYLRCASLGPEQGWDVTPSPGGDRLAARTAAGTVRLISTATWTEVAQLASPVGELDALAFSPDGTTLATVSSEIGQVTLWRAQDGASLASYDGPPGSTISDNGASLAFSQDGQRLATSLGIVIDLATGAKTSWLTGAPDTTVLTANAQNLGDGPAGIPLMRFTAGDARLFLVSTYQIGNSPPSTRLELRDPTTGTQALLFEMFTRALLGYASSPDGRYVARAGTPEASLSNDPFKTGLFVIDATTGAEIAGDPASTATPLAFSQDGSRLYTLNAGAIEVVGTTDLHPITTFAWPSGTSFVGVSPAGDLVGTTSGASAYFDPNSGALVRTLPFPLTTARWTADGRFGVGGGDPVALFHFWSEAGGTPLCGPPAGTGSAPSIASLGTTTPPDTSGTGIASTTSADGSVTVTETFILHGHLSDFFDDRLTATASGALLRQFGAYGSSYVPQPFVALSVPSGDRAYTPVATPLQPPGPDVAVWCR
jgi:WD40 repeat protein